MIFKIMLIKYKIDERISYPIVPVDAFPSYYPEVQKQEILTIIKISLPIKSEVVLLELK